MFKISIIFSSRSTIEKMIPKRTLLNVSNKYFCESNPNKLLIFRELIKI